MVLLRFEEARTDNSACSSFCRIFGGRISWSRTYSLISLRSALLESPAGDFGLETIRAMALSHSPLSSNLCWGTRLVWFPWGGCGQGLGGGGVVTTGVAAVIASWAA